MSSALRDPVFDDEGAPVSVLVDFDGTISRHDVPDMLLARLVKDQAEVRSKDQQYVDYQLGSRELMAWNMDVLPRDPDVLLAVVDDVPLDPTTAVLVAAVEGCGGAIEVVSDGLGFHVERMLSRIGLERLPVATNRAELGLGSGGVSHPYGHPTCLVCGTCKRERVRLHQAADRAVVFVGDGPSDRYAAHHADVVFAKGKLAAWCEVENVAYEPWDRLSDVAEWFELAITDGSLPPDRAAFGDWAGRTRPEATEYICGPEVWGEGRTVASAEFR